MLLRCIYNNARTLICCLSDKDRTSNIEQAFGRLKIPTWWRSSYGPGSSQIDVEHRDMTVDCTLRPPTDRLSGALSFPRSGIGPSQAWRTRTTGSCTTSPSPCRTTSAPLRNINNCVIDQIMMQERTLLGPLFFVCSKKKLGFPRQQRPLVRILARTRVTGGGPLFGKFTSTEHGGISWSDPCLLYLGIATSSPCVSNMAHWTTHRYETVAVRSNTVFFCFQVV